MTDTVLFVHGLQHSFCHMEALAKKALPRHRVIVVDLLGYGRNSDAPPAALTVSDNADYLADVLPTDRTAHVIAHSMGGAVAVLCAQRHPRRVASLINVEGNFTLKDAVFSKALAEMDLVDIRSMIEQDIKNPAGWLRRLEIEITPQRLEAATRILRMQSAETLKNTAQSLIETTARPDYLEAVRAVLDAGVPMHLVAGERSRTNWDVPEFVSLQSASLTVQPHAGHMMMVEDPHGFLEVVCRIVDRG